MITHKTLKCPFCNQQLISAGGAVFWCNNGDDIKYFANTNNWVWNRENYLLEQVQRVAKMKAFL